MSDQLEESIRQALEDARLDLSLQFHWAADGTKSGTIQIKDAGGEIVASVPLESPEAMNVALARLVLLGFRSSGAETPSRRRSPIKCESSIAFWRAIILSVFRFAYHNSTSYASNIWACLAGGRLSANRRANS